MALTVSSMLTTTPFFSPLESWLPMPMTLRRPSGVISATSATIFEVPMSRPTTSSLLSLLMMFLCLRYFLHCTHFPAAASRRAKPLGYRKSTTWGRGVRSASTV